jgi:hypothetical protein
MPPVNYIRQLRMFEDYVPHRLRFWSIVMIAIFYQFAAGIYLASLTQMVGELSFIDEDVNMGGYCTLIGLNIIFPMLFRWKFGLFTRQMFFVSSIAIICCSVAAMFVTNHVAFWVICLFAGYFKMMGMFCCMSNIQLNFTPTRSFAVFLPIIYIIVCGSIQLSGLVTAYVTYYFNWRMMNLVVLVMMIIIDIIVYFFMKHDHRSGPPIPLKGIDWIGQILWTLVCCVGAWIFTYGEHYDWWDSQEIRTASFIFILLLTITIIYSYYKKEPYIALRAFGYAETYQTLLLLFGMTIISGAIHILQPIFVGSVLNYDPLNIISLNYPELAGIIMGAILVYFTLSRWKWGVKRSLFLTFIFAAYYLVSMFYLCYSDTDKETLYLAIFAFGVAEVMMETLATYYLSQTIPFQHFFMNITIMGFVRCGVGSAAGAAIVHRLFNWSMQKNFSIVSESFTDAFPFDAMSNISMQSILMALKECYGIVAILAVVILIIILMSNYELKIKRFLPKIISVRYWMVKPKLKDPTLQ